MASACRPAAIACLLLLQAQADAHHSFAAEFTAEETATVSGTVVEVWFRNPHVRYYIEVEDENGEAQRWDTRGTSPSLLVRRGWTRDTIKVGDKVTIMGHKGRENPHLLSIIWVELADGTRLGKVDY